MDAKELYLLIEENNNKLDKCKKHDFEKAIPNKEFENEHQYRCKNCEGIVDVIYKNGYCEGLKHSQEQNRDYAKALKDIVEESNDSGAIACAKEALEKAEGVKDETSNS